MDLNEAKAEATRQWGALGGWAEEIQDPDRGAVKRVGWREPGKPIGTRKVTLGTGKTFQEAFSEALAKIAKPAPPPRERRLHPQAYPTVEMFGEPDKPQ